MHHLRRAAAAAVAALLLGGCGSDAPSTEPLDPAFAVGQHIVITGSGPQPQQLVSIVDQPIRWVNATDAEVTVTLQGEPPSPPVPPGEAFEHTPDAAVSFTYTTSASEVAGAVQVEPLEVQEDMGTGVQP
jgi:hypothetical protein